MRIIVSDTSCFIDLHKVDLLFALFALPYKVIIPHPLFEDELLSFSKAEKENLIQHGLEVCELDGNAVLQAQTYFNKHRALSLNDCFAMRLAEESKDAILVTGDANLRRFAMERMLEVHGVLWLADEFDQHGIVDRPLLQTAMHVFLNDPLVYLPTVELKRRIHRFGQPRRDDGNEK